MEPVIILDSVNNLMKTSHLSHVPKQARRKALKTQVSHDTKLYHPLKSSFMPISVLYERFLRNLMGCSESTI